MLAPEGSKIWRWCQPTRGLWVWARVGVRAMMAVRASPSAAACPRSHSAAHRSAAREAAGWRAQRRHCLKTATRVWRVSVGVEPASVEPLRTVGGVRVLVKPVADKLAAALVKHEPHRRAGVEVVQASGVGASEGRVQGEQAAELGLEGGRAPGPGRHAERRGNVQGQGRALRVPPGNLGSRFLFVPVATPLQRPVVASRPSSA